MADGRGRALWGHTSSVLALLANVNRDPKKSRPFGPGDFDPYARGAGAEPPAETVNVKDAKGLLLGAFAPRRGPTGPGGG